MNTRELGIRNFRRRLAIGIRDSVLRSIANPAGFAKMAGIPEPELGPIADLSEDQRQGLAVVIARSLDWGINHFLYGLDNQPDGFEIWYEKQFLNPEGMCCLTSEQTSIAEDSEFTEDGMPRNTQ